jgi:hypothetical protein
MAKIYSIMRGQTTLKSSPNTPFTYSTLSHQNLRMDIILRLGSYPDMLRPLASYKICLRVIKKNPYIYNIFQPKNWSTQPPNLLSYFLY